MADAVIVNPGENTVVTVGGTPVVVFPPNINGGIITNPIALSDQGLPESEPLYVNPIDAATLVANGNTFALAPGQSWVGIPGQTTPTTVNATSSGHRFSAIWW